MLVTLRHCNLVRAAERKSLRFVGDTKSNPVCAVQGEGSGSKSVLTCTF